MIQIHALTFNMLQEQTYIAATPDGLCAIIDPGCQSEAESQHLDAYIESLHLRPIGIWLTHLHLDHTYGVARCARHWNVGVSAPEADAYLLPLAADMAAGWGLPAPEPFAVDRWLRDADILEVGSETFRAISIGGHTAGSMVFYNAEAQLCLSGDVLFRFSIGRSDLAGGNAHQLISGITSRLLTLPPTVRVFPGHGPQTTIGDELHCNPYLMM